MKTKVLNLDNKAAGDVELNDAIFGLEPRQDLIQRVVVWQLAKRRSGQHKVLTRGEINRTKHKLGKQKGGGTARHGARSAPLFVGGAKAMGPVSHSHEFDLPKKIKALGLRHALSSKAKAGSIVVLDEAKSKEAKTGALAKQFGKMNLGSRALVIDGEFDKNFQLSARNLADVALLPVAGINVYDIMKSDKLVLTTAAIKAIEARLGEGNKA
ncbi:50S ribosomal protein L4 [Rhizomicrobium sp. SCGC AG-212-E05]|nr:50S ribosomal protein L4 [Rhizomicrobium sp. SCGC AG-212-E05]